MKVRLLHLLVAALVVGGCSQEGSSMPTEEGFSNARYEELPSLKAEAMRGSPLAARKLASYYGKFPNNVDNYDYWSRIAAENGSPIGQWNYALSLLDNKNDEMAQVRAKFWLQRSAAQGNQMAADRLARMQEK